MILSTVQNPDIVGAFIETLLPSVLACLATSFCKPWDTVTGTESGKNLSTFSSFAVLHLTVD